MDDTTVPAVQPVAVFKSKKKKGKVKRTARGSSAQQAAHKKRAAKSSRAKKLAKSKTRAASEPVKTASVMVQCAVPWASHAPNLSFGLRTRRIDASDGTCSSSQCSEPPSTAAPGVAAAGLASSSATAVVEPPFDIPQTSDLGRPANSAARDGMIDGTMTHEAAPALTPTTSASSHAVNLAEAWLREHALPVRAEAKMHSCIESAAVHPVGLATGSGGHPSGDSAEIEAALQAERRALRSELEATAEEWLGLEESLGLESTVETLVLEDIKPEEGGDSTPQLAMRDKSTQVSLPWRSHGGWLMTPSWNLNTRPMGHVYIL